MTHDEVELVTLLETRAIDYAFLLRSTAEDHHLKITSLPEQAVAGWPGRARLFRSSARKDIPDASARNCATQDLTEVFAAGRALAQRSHE